MEKIRIQITKGYLITLLFFIFGLVCFCKGTKAYFDSKDAILISELKFDECTTAQYVCGNIESYVVKNLEGSYWGECATWITAAGEEYHCYTIPTAGNKYIRIMIKDKANLEALGGFVRGKGDGIYIEGEIVETTTPLNYEWYKGVEEWKDKKVEELVNLNYVIKEINFSEKIKSVCIGIAFWIAAAGCFVLAGGIENLAVKERKEDKRQLLQHISKYNRENELEAEKMRLDSLKQRLNRLRRSCFYKVPIAILGIGIFTCSYFVEVRMAGGIIAVVGMVGIWKYFINSNIKIAQGIARLFGLNTIWLQMEMCEYRIQVLDEAISG